MTPTCTCAKWATSLDIDDECPVPGHGMVPAEPVAADAERRTGVAG